MLPRRTSQLPTDAAAEPVAERVRPSSSSMVGSPLRGPDDPSALTLLWTPRPEELTGRPGYHLGRRIGKGGFAEVFEAELHRPPLPPKRVALKRLLPGLRADPTRKRQLRREAQIATRLDHANIVRVFELLELGDELLIAMELVDGVQASRLLHRLAGRGRGLRLPVVAYLLRGLFAALDYLATCSPLVEADSEGGPPRGSSRPLVHADISLENLMLTAAGGVKLIDFGLAGEDRSLPPLLPAGEDQSLTALHQVAGKSSYAPPGEGGQVSGAPTVQRDLYAAGVCAWELLTGRRFPSLPPGAAARELGSLIAFAAEGLPAAGWQLLQLCLSMDKTAQRGTAAQGLALLHELRPDAVSPSALGALVQTLVAEEQSTTNATELFATPLSEPTEFAEELLHRLHGAFCAHRVVLFQPTRDTRSRASSPPAASAQSRPELTFAPAASPGFIVQKSRGPEGEPPCWAAVGQALRRGYAEDPAGGLYYRVQPPIAGTPSGILYLDPGPGRVYDLLAQALLRNLLCPVPGPSASPSHSDPP